jgi:hypothetical protein
MISSSSLIKNIDINKYKRNTEKRRERDRDRDRASEVDLNTYLRTQIGNGYSSKNKTSNNVIRRRSALDVCWDEPLVCFKSYVEFKYL